MQRSAGTTTVWKNLLEREGYTPYCGEALMCTAGLPRTTWDGAQFRCRCGWRSEFPADFIAAYKARWGIPSEGTTAPDFFAAMAVGIPPITPPTAPAPIWIGVDLASGPDMSVEVGRAADGTFYAVTQEQSHG